MFFNDWAIYVEYMLDGVFHNDFFASWSAFHAATFNPDIDILEIVDKSAKTIKRKQNKANKLKYGITPY